MTLSTGTPPRDVDVLDVLDGPAAPAAPAPADLSMRTAPLRASRQPPPLWRLLIGPLWNFSQTPWSARTSRGGLNARTRRHGRAISPLWTPSGAEPGVESAPGARTGAEDGD